MFEQRYNRFTTRSARRRRRQRLLAALRVAVLAAAGALLVEGAAAALYSPRFAVTTLRVQNARSVPPGEIAARLGLRPGDNVFRLRTGRLQARVAAHPALAGASIHRQPPGTLVVRVVERRPVAFVRKPGGILYLDAQGYVFGGPPTLAKGLCELHGVPLPAAGRQCREARVTTALAARQRLQAVGLPAARISLGPANRLTARAANTTLVLGEGRDLAAKADLAKLVLARLAGAGAIEYVDLSSLEVPVWKPQGGNTATVPTAPAVH